MSNGMVTQIIGAVIDVEFDKDNIPKVYEALMIDESGTTLEVQQQLGDGVVRTIAMGATEGLKRGLSASRTNAPISVPVGPETLGRIVDVLGNPIDEKGPIGGELCDHIHYGEFKILEAICMLQNDMYEDAMNSLFGWLKKYQGRKVLKCLNALSAFLDQSNLIIPPRPQYRNNLVTH